MVKSTRYPSQQPSSASLTRPRKREWAHLLARISTILLAISITGVVTACASGSSGSTGNTPSGSTTPKPTATIPAGFTKYNSISGLFTMVYPSDWKVEGGGGVFTGDFTGPGGQHFSVDLEKTAKPGDEASVNADACQNVAKSLSDSTGTPIPAGITIPATITINGQQWQQLDCGNLGTEHWVVESHISGEVNAGEGNLYFLDYGSPSATFALDKAQFFSVMEQSFTYIGG